MGDSAEIWRGGTRQELGGNLSDFGGECFGNLGLLGGNLGNLQELGGTRRVLEGTVENSITGMNEICSCDQAFKMCRGEVLVHLF